MLSDEQWLVLEPLVEACRPAAKVPSQTLRETMSAIVVAPRERRQVALGARWVNLPQTTEEWWNCV